MTRGVEADALAGSRDARRARAVETAGLFVLLTLIPLRAFLPETHTLEVPEWARRLDAPAGPTPAVSLVVDGFVFACFAAVLAARLAAGGIVWFNTGAEPGVLLVIVGGVLAAVQAGQKRPAVFGAVDFAAVLLYFLTLRQLVRRPWQVRLVMCVALATGVAVAVKCVVQVVYDHPATLAHYQQYFADDFRAAGGPMEAGQLDDFERRLRSGAATGYLAHANVTASLLGCVVLAALALAWERRRQAALGRAAAVAPLLAAALAAVALVLTQSKGAGAALLMGLVGWIAWQAYGARLGRRRVRLVVAFWLAAAVVVAGVTAYGMSTRGLPTRSLLFRWQYWQGAAAMLRVGGPWGVGPNNFGVHFTRYKPVECPEEVQDPHSWLVRAFVEWGVLGGIGLCMLWIGVTVRLARVPLESPPEQHLRLARFGEEPPGRIVRWCVSLAATLAAGYAAVNAGNFAHPEHARFVLIMLVEAAGAWLIACLLLSVEGRVIERFDDRPLGGLQAGLLAAAGAFVLHTAVDMGLYWAGAATPFGAILAAALASDPNGATGRCVRPRPRSGAAAAALGVAALAGYAVFVVRPPLLAGVHLAAAHRLPAPATWEQFERSGVRAAYLRAAAADPLDPTALRELVGVVVGGARPLVTTRNECDAALDWIDALRRADPHGAAADFAAARLYEVRHGLTGDARDLHLAASAMAQAVTRYPTSPERRVRHALLLERLAAVENSAGLRARAATELEIALRLDAQRIYVSPLHHFSPNQQAALRDHIAQLRAR